MKNKITLKMEVIGYKLQKEEQEDKSFIEYVQFQTLEDKELENGDIKTVTKTLKLNRTLTKEELELFEDTVVIESNEDMGLKEYIFDFDKGYACNDFKIIKEELDSPFMVNNSIQGKVKNVHSKEVENKEKVKKTVTVIQLIDRQENAIKLTDIKYNGSIKDYKNLKGKDVLIENLNISIFKKRKYISTDTAPKLVK